MNALNPEQQAPDTPCPPWCRMHVEGRHVGELELTGSHADYNIYVRPTDYGNGEVGMEVIVAKPDGMKTTRVDIEPDEVKTAARLAEQRAIAPPNDGPTEGDSSGQQL